MTIVVSHDTERQKQATAFSWVPRSRASFCVSESENSLLKSHKMPDMGVGG